MIVNEIYIAERDGGNWGSLGKKIFKGQRVELQRNTGLESEAQALQKALKANGFYPDDYRIFKKV